MGALEVVLAVLDGGGGDNEISGAPRTQLQQNRNDVATNSPIRSCLQTACGLILRAPHCHGERASERAHEREQEREREREKERERERGHWQIKAGTKE